MLSLCIKNFRPKSKRKSERNKKSRNSNGKTWKTNRKTRNRKHKSNKKTKRNWNKKKELEELETEKTNETTAIIPKEVRLPYFSRYVFQLINQAREKKVFEKCIRITNILKDLIMKKK